MLTITPLTRTELLKCMPERKTIAEIGVWNGHFAADILKNCTPRELHLVDPWGGGDDAYVKTYNIKHDMQAKYEAVLSMFSEEIKAGTVKVHRTHSYSWLPTVPDGGLDWLYLDGMHTYEAVEQDLAHIDKKIADDGFIVGHDFSNYHKRGFGVVSAVRDFVRKRGYKLLLITLEPDPTYVIAKAPGGAVEALVSKVIRANGQVIQMDEQLLDGFYQTPLVLEDNKRLNLFNFKKP